VQAFLRSWCRAALCWLGRAGTQEGCHSSDL